MSATFLIRIDVPDSRSVAHDASLEAAGESVFQYGLGLDAEISGENRLTELSRYTLVCQPEKAIIKWEVELSQKVYI